MRKTSGKIYARDLSPSPTVRINPKQSRTTLCPTFDQNQLSYQNSLQTSKNSDKIYFTLGTSNPNAQPQSDHNESSLQGLPTCKYAQIPHIDDTIMSSRGSCFNQSLSGDSLAIYENPITRNNQIVRKLGVMNNIFKELGLLKKENFDIEQLKQLELVQNELIELERNILRI